MSGPQCPHCEQPQEHVRPHANVPQDCLDEALEEIETLARDLLRKQAENRRQRAALEQIACTDYRGTEPWTRQVAREALDQ